MKVAQQYELVGTTKIQPHPENPRQSSVLEIEESIDVNGWYGVCTVQKSTGYILAGSHRYLAAKAHGAKKVPVVWVDVDDETAKRIMLIDNRGPDLGGYDEEKLEALLGSVESLEGTGYLEDFEAEQEQAEKESKGEGAEDVPDDKYDQQFGVIVLCNDEEHQEHVYRQLQKLSENTKSKAAPAVTGCELRIVAV